MCTVGAKQPGCVGPNAVSELRMGAYPVCCCCVSVSVALLCPIRWHVPDACPGACARCKGAYETCPCLPQPGHSTSRSARMRNNCAVITGLQSRRLSDCCACGGAWLVAPCTRFSSFSSMLVALLAALLLAPRRACMGPAWTRLPR